MIARNLSRIAKFRSWREQVAASPNDYRIEYRREDKEFAEAVFLMRKADDQWYVIESLDPWFFAESSDDRSVCGIEDASL